MLMLEPPTKLNKEMTEDTNVTKLLMTTNKEELLETQIDKLFQTSLDYLTPN
jgi:hypothetical protein